MIKTKIAEVFQDMGWPSAKPEQHQIVEAILNRDVFVILLTGYGKECLLSVFATSSQKDVPK